VSRSFLELCNQIAVFSLIDANQFLILQLETGWGYFRVVAIKSSDDEAPSPNQYYSLRIKTLSPVINNPEFSDVILRRRRPCGNYISNSL
jgi:hypothetical protein